MLRKFVPVFSVAAASLSFWFGTVPTANAIVLYDSTVTPRIDPTTPPSQVFFNLGEPTHIEWDDVPVVVGLNPSAAADINLVQFGILRRPNAAAVTIDAYWAPMVADNGVNREGTNPNAFDGAEEDPGTPAHIGQITLGANGNTVSNSLITFGDGVSSLFNTGPLDFTYSPTVGYFMLGLKFSTADGDNGWITATGVNNLDVLWEDFQDGSPSTIAEFTFGQDALGADIIGTQSIRVLGTVPEPTSLSLLAIGGLAALRRRRVMA